MAGKLPRSYLEKHGASVHQQLMHEHPNLRFTYVNLRYSPASGTRPAHALPRARCLVMARSPQLTARRVDGAASDELLPPHLRTQRVRFRSLHARMREAQTHLRPKP
jgi:hypothetical protein